MRRDPAPGFSMLLFGVSLACYSPSLKSVQDQAYTAAVVLEGKVQSVGPPAGGNDSRGAGPAGGVLVKVLDLWPLNSGGLQREQLISVGSKAPCFKVKRNHRYIFFLEPTEEPLVFRTAFAPLDTSAKNLKRDVARILCTDCAAPPKLKKLKSPNVHVGEKISLKCEATAGNPQPSYKWFKDGKELKKSKDIRIKYGNGKKISRLQFNKVKLEDAGEYSCEAENILGKDTAKGSLNVKSVTTTLSSWSGHARKCNETAKSYCVNGGVCYYIEGINQLSCKCPIEFTGDRCQHFAMVSFSKHLGFELKEAEELYQKRVLTITGICVALLVVGIVCVVAYCKTKKQRKQMHNHLRQNMCPAHQNRSLANGPSHPRLDPEEIQMADYISKNVSATEHVIRRETETTFSGSHSCSPSHHCSTATPTSSQRYVSALTTPARLSPVDFHYSMTTQVPTFEITSPNSAHAVSLPPAAPISFRVEEQQPLLRRYQLPFQDTQRYDSYYQRKTYLNDSMGSLPSSPFRITEDDEYETTQEYVTALEQPKKTASSNRRWKKSKLNGHIPHRARAVRDSFSLSSASYSESDEELVAESTPFLSTQNNEAAHAESPPLHRPGDSRTHYSCRGHSAHGDGGRGSLAHVAPKADPDPL
ncbi:pro-neuregulin-2, membrane-bound isoform isoform X1 [Molothrus ater]|uniref:pro-neuregulin-2, membrane-bound isoform isoform X1 n=1 Tax=Molothrus ater TaxID=84834 RepID=UPI0023E895BE|nr:pro-neuregulin-2, membrane-bound isoform isoform X1 [Molothrus ater]